MWKKAAVRDKADIGESIEIHPTFATEMSTYNLMNVPFPPREDLYYRLNVFPITIPPLRERGSDIITLADHFVAHFAKEPGKEVKRISTPALNMMMSYHWPGNVRELENVIERAVILSDDEVVHGYNLPPSLQTSVLTGTFYKGQLEEKLASVEYEMLIEALKAHNGNMTNAARELA